MSASRKLAQVSELAKLRQRRIDQLESKLLQLQRDLSGLQRQIQEKENLQKVISLKIQSEREGQAIALQQYAVISVNTVLFIRSLNEQQQTLETDLQDVHSKLQAKIREIQQQRQELARARVSLTAVNTLKQDLRSGIRKIAQLRQENLVDDMAVFKQKDSRDI